MRRILSITFFALLGSLCADAQISAVSGYCNQGATRALISNIKSTNYQQGIIPGCTVTVYLTGTQDRATIYSDSAGTEKSNPFTANAIISTNPGAWMFYATEGEGYDVVLSSGSTVTDVFPGGGGGTGAYLPLAGGEISGDLQVDGTTSLGETTISENLTVDGSFVTSGMTTSSLATPTGLGGVSSTSGGSLTSGTYYAVVTAVDGSGNTTVASTEASATTTGSASSIVWTWSAVVNAFSYQLYIGTSSGGETAYFSTTDNTYTQTVSSATPLSVQSTGYWHTSGNQILDANDTVVRIAGINWYGFETTDEVAHGLYNQDYKTIIDTIYDLGYNVIRLPFSNQMIEDPIVPTAIAFVDIDDNAINTDLEDLDALHVMDKIITYAGTLNIRVILDNHRSEAGDSAEASGLWYTTDYPQSAWLADWQTLVTRYEGYTTTSGQPTVVGADIRNEPHDATSGGACWTGDTGATTAGCPTSDTANNWPVAATLAGNDILAINSSWLIFVEGVDYYDGVNDWWGGNLMGVESYPITLNTSNRIVYSAHDYGPNLYAQSWFTSSTTYDSLSVIWNKFWGYISSDGIAPVWIGEFGTDNAVINISSTVQGSQGQWFSDFITYMKNNSAIGWTYYALDGDDSYALLDYNYDPWPANPTKQQLLNSIQPPYNTATNGYLGQAATEGTTGSVNIAGNLFVNGGITTNGNVIAKLGKFASGVKADGPMVADQSFTANSTVTLNDGFTSNLSGIINGDLTLTQKGVPGAPTGTFASTGGTVAAATYYAKLVSVDDTGYTTQAGTESTGVAATGSTGEISWTWTAVSGTSTYRIYVGTSSDGESSYFTTTTNSYTQTTSAGTTGTVPTVNHTGSLVLPSTTTGCLQSTDGLVSGTGSDCGSGSGSGTVTSVGLSLPSDFTVSNSPITASGTLAGVWTTTPTGTGAVVRATSPTLVTPNIGAATASSLTDTGAAATSGSYCLQIGTTGAISNTGAACGTGSGTGTVTSVGMSVPSIFSVTPSTITSTGTFSISLASETANYAFLAPDGAAGTPTFRAITSNDIATALASSPAIGSSTPAAGTFTTLSANTSVYSPIGNLTTVNSTTVNSTNISSSGTDSLGTVTSSALSSGSVTDTGLTVAGYVTNTSAGVLGTVSEIPVAGITTALASPSAIGSSTPSTGAFTTLSANTSVYSPIGNLTTVNATTGNITTISGTSISESGSITGADFVGTGSATIVAGSTTVTGTSPSLAVYGSGASAEIDFTVGTSPSASGVIGTVTFPTAYPSSPKAVIVGNGTALPSGSGFSWTTTTTTLVLSCSSTLTAGTYYKLIFILIA
jgi:endoglucanase